MSTNYSSPVSELLTLGDCRDFSGWPDYPDLVGLGPEHVPELIRMATDEDLNWADPESLEVWAPVHAWRALGQLRATAASEPLLELFQEVEEGNDWVGDELPEVYGMMAGQPSPLSSGTSPIRHMICGRASRRLIASSVSAPGTRPLA